MPKWLAGEKADQAAALRRPDAPVFVCPPWPDVFAPDRERPHDFGHGCRDQAANVAAYAAAGYQLIEIPRAPAAGRAGFVLETPGTLRGSPPSNPRENR